MVRLFKKKRRYPIKRDKEGKSARQRAFSTFDEGLNPKETCKIIDISRRTANRYYHDWKKRGPRFGLIYRIAREASKTGDITKIRAVKLFADSLGIPVEEVQKHLQQSWGLHQLLSGKLRDKVRAGEKDRGLERLVVISRLVYLEERREVSPRKILDMLEFLERSAATEKRGISKLKK